MIFVIGLVVFLFGVGALGVLSAIGRYESHVSRWTDTLVVIPFFGGALMMFVSLCMLLWRLLP